MARDKILLGYLPWIFFLISPRQKVTPKTLLILKYDAIGDYVLFRNFLEAVRKSEKYKDWKITLCGNIAYKDLAECLDKEFIDDFIWIEKGKIRKDLKYTWSIFHEAWKRGFEAVLHPSYGREVIPDFLARITNAPERIGSESDQEILNMKPHQKEITDKYYTKLIPRGPEIFFEFLRYRIFFEQVLDQKIDQRFFIDTQKIRTNLDLDKNFAVIFPGASHENRRWKPENFARIADYLKEKYNLKSCVCGNRDDKKYYEKVAENCLNSKPEDFTGKSLPEFAKILSKAKIIITNDTVAAHMGAAVGAKVISLLNGRHFGRFSPYPPELTSSFRPIYPPKLQAENKSNWDFLKKKYKNKTDANINDIAPETVIKEIDSLLADKKQNFFA